MRSTFAQLYLTKVGDETKSVSFDLRPSDVVNIDVRCKVERVFGASHPDSIEIEKAKEVLKEHEQALVDAIARLEGASFAIFSCISFLCFLIYDLRIDLPKYGPGRSLSIGDSVLD